MEDKEALEHKLPSVDTYGNEVQEEVVSAKQMEMPAASSSFGQSPADLPFSVHIGASSQTATLGGVQSNDPTIPIQADDVDLIEKAWVEKAKAIVRSTHGDPYAQNKELNKVKAVYIKKRFDKDIKVSE